VLIVSVVSVKFNVDALADPGEAHDDEELQEEDQLVAGVGGGSVGGGGSSFSGSMVHRLLKKIKYEILLRILVCVSFS
jgi:hypothetical protein